MVACLVYIEVRAEGFLAALFLLPLAHQALHLLLAPQDILGANVLAPKTHQYLLCAQDKLLSAPVYCPCLMG